MSIILVAGTRPNFIKIAPIIRELAKATIPFSLVHTGQHYQDNLNEIFFRELNLPKPNINLQVGSGSQAEQTGQIMIRFESYLKTNPAPFVLVVGDVNSTMACSIVAKKMNRTLLHVEAGIRSFDLTMPEEINRMVTDSIADQFYTTSSHANENLTKSGIPATKIHFVGNTMIDTLLHHLNQLEKPTIFDTLQLEQKKYWVLTLHRPSNVDNPEQLASILTALHIKNTTYPILFPVHPRLNSIITEAFKKQYPSIHFMNPVGYLAFIYFIKNSIGVITDSGGIQEETTVLNIPCLTLRKNTERPETIHLGTNELIPSLNELQTALTKVISGNWKKGTIPPFWDGMTAKRIVQHIQTL